MPTVRANAIAFAPEVEGRLVQLSVQDNQPIHKGDLLFQIDSRPYEYALQQARADQATLEGQIEDERRRIATQQSAVGTARAGVSGSQSNISSVQGGLLAAKALVERARAAQLSAEAQLKFAQNDYDPHRSAARQALRNDTADRSVRRPQCVLPRRRVTRLPRSSCSRRRKSR